MHPAKPQAILNVSGKEMFVVYKSCHLAQLPKRILMYGLQHKAASIPVIPAGWRMCLLSINVDISQRRKGCDVLVLNYLPSCAFITCLSSSLPLPSSIKIQRFLGSLEQKNLGAPAHVYQWDPVLQLPNASQVKDISAACPHESENIGMANTFLFSCHWPETFLSLHYEYCINDMFCSS